MIPGSANALLLATAAPTGYNIQRSLRFNSSDSAYCLRTPSSNGTSYTTWTWSMWVKRSAPGVSQVLFSAGINTNDYLIVNFESGDALRLVTGENGATNQNLVTTAAVFRDYSAWYHIVVQADFDNGTQADRIKIYVNGTRQTISGTIATQGYAGTTFNRSGIAHNIGRQGNGVSYFSGYLADIHFIDGQALTPSSFAETNATTGQWVPKAYTGSYGTNGFNLTFSDNSGTTATTLGKDAAGSNNWTPTNFSVASGAGNDSLVDTPTSYGTDTGAGGEVRGNYATLNPLDKGSNAALTNGNLDVASTTQSWSGSGVRGTIGLATGKWYWEITCLTNVSGSANIHLGIATAAASLNNYLGADASGWAYTGFGAKYNNNSGTSYGVSNWVSGAVVGVALDLDNGTLTFYHNGVSQGQAYSGLTGSTYFPAISVYNASAVFNAGARPFAYTAPSGFKALCDTNLPAPVVAKPSNFFDVIKYIGNGTAQTVSGLNFSPDFLWGKNRSSAFYHILVDSIRGATARLFSNTTDAESVFANSFTAFTSNGFSVGSASDVNNNNDAIVTWCWDAGTTTASNGSGSIISSVRASASSGFSVVTWTGTGGAGTVGHGLGVAPAFVIVKNRSRADDWLVYSSTLGANKFLQLNTNNAVQTANQPWNNTSPTSTVFSVFADTGTWTNKSGDNYVAYCFAPVAGYSAFGGYEAGTEPFVYLGFRPAFLLIKRTASSDGWCLFDSKRASYNTAFNRLEANSSGAETSNSSEAVDLLSNGFKIKTTWGGMGGSTGSGTMAFMAFAENPFQYARAR